MEASYIILYLAVSMVTVEYVHSASSICFDCKHLDDPDACKRFHPCQDDESCFKELVETDNGTAAYSWGCASSQLCFLENSNADRKKRLSIERCFQCCHGNFCNFGPCTIDLCANVACKHAAVCRNTALKYVCDCPVGYTGHLCEIDIDECSSDPCQNNALCSDNVGGYNCSCLQGYSGINCETDNDGCAGSSCINGATCIDGINSFTCMCDHGYTGTLCETDIDECAPSPCQLNTICVDLVNGYRCNCPPGISGINCQINIDDCENVTCKNNGICYDYINRFECKCPFGFQGTFCENSLGRVCYTCDGVAGVHVCTNQSLCSPAEECYMEHELISPGVFHYNMGCVPSQMCKYLQSTQKQRRSTLPIQLCYECCDSNGCNNQACNDTHAFNINS